MSQDDTMYLNVFDSGCTLSTAPMDRPPKKAQFLSGVDLRLEAIGYHTTLVPGAQGKSRSYNGLPVVCLTQHGHPMP